ncbi:unnamed protein product [Ilex paraguariensis]|uniref:Methyl-CpG-binding domain-containing protein 2 n=1 Tax=Ilex paraguariensis TaxID=185542 RepID=A0ABC8SK47_9AQUA
MQPHPLKLTIKLKGDDINDSDLHSPLNSSKMGNNALNDSAFTGHLESAPQEQIDVTSLEEDHGMEDGDNQYSENAQNQLVVYDPAANGAGEIEAAPYHTGHQSLRFLRYSTSRVLPSVGAFTVQCAHCFKWRLIPTKEKYEEIREHIIEQPFVCETAREWRPEISCDDPADIFQDGSRLWAIDKPNIAQPPPGWQRLLRIRGEGSTKFADVYYVAPSGKRLRSMVEIQKYLDDHPDYIKEGVSMSQFSFQIPRPLQENYVRKRPARFATVHDASRLGMPGSLEPSEVNPIAWAGPDENIELQLGGPGLSTPYMVSPDLKLVNQPVKKKRTRTPSKRRCDGEPVCHLRKVKVEEPHRP